MPNSRSLVASKLRRGALGLAVVLAGSAAGERADAQTAQGFAVERFYPSAPGGGWFVMDSLDMRGGLGGAMEVQGGYARNPLRVPDGGSSLPVVSDQAFADVGFAVTYDRWRLYLNIDAPLVTQGESGTASGFAFTAPSVSVAETPDLVGDVRVGLDARVVGAPSGPFRLGAGAQLFVPAGDHTSDDDTDGTYRAMLRLLAAGDVGSFAYAAQIGVHIRPRDDGHVPDAPEGSELLFGVAAGARFHVGASRDLVIGPEVFGETAFRSLFGSNATGVEALLGARVEGTADDGLQVRVKLGTGGGLDPEFGAPEWRFVLGIEMGNHRADRDHDGVSDANDACPDARGVKTTDPKTNGCPELRRTE